MGNVFHYNWRKKNICLVYFNSVCFNYVYVILELPCMGGVAMQVMPIATIYGRLRPAFGNLACIDVNLLKHNHIAFQPG
jgi:hypothetical protein